MLLLLITTLFLTANCHPIQDGGDDAIPVEIQRDINVVSYIENFKNAMTEYVTSQYTNLTIQETENVKDVLENFLKTFANDLREAVERQFKNEELKTNYEEVPDGIPDDTFQNIKEKVKSEFPDIDEDTAKDIIYRLRKNLFETRQKLDHIIRQSQIAQFEIALD